MSGVHSTQAVAMDMTEDNQETPDEMQLVVAETLQTCRPSLCLQLQNLELVTRLQAVKAITFVERQKIEAERTDFEKNGKLVDILTSKAVTAFEQFLSALSETGQDHIRQYLVKTEKKIEAERTERHNLR